MSWRIASASVSARKPKPWQKNAPAFSAFTTSLWLAGLQRDLFREEVETDLAAIEAELEPLKAAPRPTVVAPRSSRSGRQPLPNHLPRIEHRHGPASCTCGQCGGERSHIRDDITEQLDVEPAKFFVHRPLCPLGIFGHNTPAGRVRWPWPSRYRRLSLTAA